MVDLTTLKTRLAEAEAARHKIAIGGGVEHVWRDGRRVSYTKQTIADLDAYIRTLEQQIESAGNAAAGKPKRRAIPISWA